MSVVNMLPAGGANGLTVVQGPLIQGTDSEVTRSKTVTAAKSCWTVVYMTRDMSRYTDRSVQFKITCHGSTTTINMPGTQGYYTTRQYKLSPGDTLKVEVTATRYPDPHSVIVATGTGSIS